MGRSPDDDAMMPQDNRHFITFLWPFSINIDILSQ